MAELAKQTRATIVPALQYRDAAAAIDWLCKAFGFTQRMVVPDEEGGIAHAELTFGNGMIMLGSRRYGNSFSTAATTRGSIGSTLDGNVATIRPSRPIRYLWKFHDGASNGRSSAAHL
jgi:uncharacterized glyoxalase superfamily protein PhnB